MSKSEMFCFRCEQTARGTGCHKIGICGKKPRTAALHDLLVFALKGVGVYAHRVRRFGIIDRGLDELIRCQRQSPRPKPISRQHSLDVVENNDFRR